MSPFVRFARTFALCLAPMLVAHAQVDPRLMGDKGSFKTDFLDMLQRATDLKVKPEILTLFDFSGSMGFLAFHKEFPNWENHESSGSSANHYNIRVTANADDTLYIRVTTLGGADRTSFDMAARYPGAGMTGTMDITGIKLVNPAGQEVTAAKAEECKSATWTRYPGMPASGFSWVDHDKGKNNAVNWVRAASHARMKFSMAGHPDREIDIPLAWAVIRQSETNTKAPLERVLLSDPTDSAAPKLEVDSTFLDSPSSIGGSRTADLTWTTGTSTRPNTAIIGNYFCYLRLDYLYWMYTAKKDGNYIVPDAATQKDGYPFNNGLPTVTRLQALKEAAMRTWLTYQDRVFWAYRTLQSSSEGGPSPRDIGSSSVTVPSDNDTEPSRVWVSFNKGKRSKTGGSNQYDNGIARLSKLQASGGTYLNGGLLNSFAQSVDAGNDHVWVKALDPDEKPYECSGTFVIALTDGVPSDEPGTLLYPYAGSQDPIDGNKLVIADADPNKTGRPVNYAKVGEEWFNLPTIAAIAAHSGNIIYGSPGTNYIYSPDVNNTYPGISRKTYPTNPSDFQSFLPYAVVQRGTATKFKQPRPIQTLTVGMSLGDAYSASPWNGGTKRSLTHPDALSSPKYRLVAAAHYGDPDRTKFDMSKAGTYEESKLMPYNLPSGKSAPPTCYFDAADPDSLVSNMALAFDEILSRVDKGSSAAPVVPYSGLGLGAQVYLASFIPSELGPIWTGDLRMYGTLTDGTSIKILDATGTEITGDLLKAAPMWSAASYLDGLAYKNRKVYTRLPNATSLVRFDPFDAAGMTALSPHFATKDMSGATLSPALSAAQKKDIARYLIGSSLDQDDNNRPGVMGDVIDSSISVVEYDATKLNTANLSSTLSTMLAQSGAKFRAIYVGTNTGFLHAFGEVSYPELVTVGTRKFNITRGVIQELWSFIPTDFLAQIQFLKDPAQSHRHLVDGTSVVHHLDLPASGQRNPDGKVNPENVPANLERAVLVFGLGKGGRSYYALNIRDPFTPVFAWTVNPDEAATAAGQAVILSAKDSKGIALTNLASDIQKMGFATSKPAVGRVLFPHATENAAYQFRDVCFLGGGLSSPEMEEKFKTGATAPAMGRLVLGVDVYTGKYMASYDLMSLSGAGTDKTKIDCVPAGVIPFEFFLGTGLTQRLYFADYRRGLWSIGSGLVNDKDASNNDHPFKGFRRDVSQMDLWKKPSATVPYLRKVFTAPDKDYFSLLPAPFLVGTYPVPRGTAPLVTPAVTGIALSSGTKHNPMDRFYSAATLPSHRLYMLFDRQDGPKEGLTDTQGILTTKLFNVTSTTEDTRVDPTRLDPDKFSPVYFLAPTTKGGPTPYYGYTLDFPGAYDPTTAIPDVIKLVPKALTEPVVLVGTLFYSYFKPGADYDPCTGGTGDTNSFRVCDVFSPKLAADASTVVNASPAKYCETGKVFAWNGLSTQFVARGTQASTQAGLVNVASGSGGATTTTTVQIKTATTKQAEQWPRVRTWRSVYDY